MQWRRHNVDTPDGTGWACCPVASPCPAPPSVVPHRLLCPVFPLIAHSHWLATMPARRTSSKQAAAPARPISPHNSVTDDPTQALTSAVPEDVMAPPPAPASQDRSQEDNDISEKYKRLKRRYCELDEVCYLAHGSTVNLTCGLILNFRNIKKQQQSCSSQVNVILICARNVGV
jgi:hypothetical protein